MLKQRLIGFTLAAVVGSASIGLVESWASEKGLSPQISNEGGVKVTVAPQGFSSEAKIWDFAVTLETHTQPLDDDLAKSSTLIGGGKSYRPLNWEGAPPGGHHRKGVLRFQAITPLPQAVELQIRRTEEASPRIFRWQLK